MKQNNHFLVGMGPFFTLWSTQALSSLGSAMTGFALIVWSYQQSGSAFTTALLSVCTYAPYVALSLFAGALSDRWDKRKTMLACDALATMGTCALLFLWAGGKLALWHLYLLNALLRLSIPVELQGRVYAVRNTFQFFTIPVGYLLGGALVDKGLEPLLAAAAPDSVPALLFGTGKGAGAAALFFLLAVLGEATCLFFRRSKALWALEGS